MGEKDNISRREFLIMSSFALLASGKIVWDELEDYNSEMKRNRIYNELPNHVYLSTTNFEFFPEDDKSKQAIKGETIGSGIILDGNYISMTHFFPFEYRNLEYKQRVVPKFTKKEVKLDGKVLENIVFDVEHDSAVYKLPKDLNLPDFPCKPTDDIMLGDEIYIIGNPRLTGRNIRKGFVSDLDSWTEKYDPEGTFGIDTGIAPGDSGCPIVNSNFELLGLVYARVEDLFGYIQRIKYFKK